MTERVPTTPSHRSGMMVVLARAALPCTTPAMTSGPVTDLLALARVLATADPPANSVTAVAPATAAAASFVLSCMSRSPLRW